MQLFKPSEVRVQPDTVRLVQLQRRAAILGLARLADADPRSCVVILRLPVRDHRIQAIVTARQLHHHHDALVRHTGARSKHASIRRQHAERALLNEVRQRCRKRRQ